MLRIILILLYLGHVLGDFYFQSPELAAGKDKCFQKLCRHSVIYFCSMIAVIIPVFRLSLFLWVFFISITHFMIDSIKFLIKKKKISDEKSELTLYVLDQAAHMLIIVFTGSAIYLLSTPVDYIYGIQFISDRLGIDITNVFSWILILLMLIRPFSITIKKVLYLYRPEIEAEERGHLNAGALIGILERCIILLMLAAGQYSAIGFVLTAKSIARYRKITDDPKFSEYYLLGTLLSTLLVIMIYLVIFK